jgi:tetraacyldisaccharide 4'-kinase
LPDARRQAWLGVVSGARRGPGAAAARAGLSLLAALYRVGLAAREALLHLGGAPERVCPPVVSVGNLTVGGTGKTPMVALLARLAADLGARVAVATRGYKAAAGERGDEALELERLLPGVAILQGKDRARAIRQWTRDHPCDLVILDDGFQYRRLHRDLDIVLVDALEPFGFGHVLPRGLLREPLCALERADLVVLTRADLVNGERVEAIRREVRRRAAPDTPVLASRHRPSAVVLADGSRASPESLRGSAVAAACGIGRPDAFRRTLEGLGAGVALWRTFPDHHAYAASDVADLLAETQAAGLKTLVTTGKDYVKWGRLIEPEAGATRVGGLEYAVGVAALEVELELLERTDAVRQRLADLLAVGAPRP